HTRALPISHTHTHTHTHTHAITHPTYTHTLMWLHTHTHTHAITQPTYTHTLMWLHTHAHTHTHTHTHTLTHTYTHQPISENPASGTKAHVNITHPMENKSDTTPLLIFFSPKKI